ncbi:MAG: diguanylate cyclase, partial [Rubrivivax sp.]|nr:diguanylate cyclase [Rubrivivax sp.]
VRAAVVNGIGIRQEWLNLKRDGTEFWADVDLRPLRDADGRLTGYISVASDVTDRRALQNQLSHHAHTDALTQLPNRTAVMERLHKAIAHAGRHAGYGFAVLFMDFDRFKQVNDTMGHAAGDELLRQVAQRLQLLLRPGDALARLQPAEGGTGDVAARIGGDEFVVVLEAVANQDTVKVIAERVLKELSEPYTIGCAPLQSSVSIGVVLHLGHEGAEPPSAEDVLRNADTAMYEAKRAGRGRWVMFDDSMHERVVRTLEVEKDLRRALKEDELFVVYQPVVDLPGRAVVGVEALVRWRHPERGLVPPAEFIGVAEESGLIDAVGAVVLRKACQQFVRWRADLGERAPR